MPDPDVHFARSRDGHVAYQTSGAGPLDLVLVVGSGSTSLLWEEPWAARFLRRLASFCRLITFDQRGSGRSDPVDANRPLLVEERVEDLLAVLDATGSRRATIFGFHDGGPVAMLLAATHPQRLASLILCNTWARLPAADDYPWGVRPDILDLGAHEYAARWGTGESLAVMAPSMAADPTLKAAWPRHEQLSHSPSQTVALAEVFMQLDVRNVVSAITAPTLVLHTVDNMVIDIGHGRFLKDHIPGARLLELPGADHLLYVSPEETISDEIEEFMIGERGSPLLDRVLATVLFTDIVESTPHVLAVGDRRWATALDVHNDVVARELAVYRGRQVSWNGDGILATFDGPARAVRCAQAIIDESARRQIDVRAGLHTGEVERRGVEIGGIAVHLANRVAGLAGPRELLVSSTVRDLVAGSGLAFTSRGFQQLKGVPEAKELFAVDV
ncbi:MAG: adenylate/guanylate cyclase domain-containing protein [Actinomycetes bacterium]